MNVSDHKRSLIFINIIFSCVAATLLTTALNTALPSISSDLNINITTSQWLVSGYTLAQGCILPLTAFLMRRFPTKNLYPTGCGIFVVGLFMDLVAQNFAILMFGRVMQACGNGMLVAMAQVILLTIYPEEKKGAIMGWYGLAVSVAPVVAPTIGGILVDQISWRAIFALGLAVMVFSFVISCCVFENVLETHYSKFDFGSFMLSVLGFGGLTLGIGNVASMGIKNPLSYLSLTVGVIALVLFIYTQNKKEQPLINLKILKIKQYTVGVIAIMLIYVVVMASSVLMPLYVQTVKGYSATFSGLVTLPGSLAMAVISPFAGRIYDRVGIKRLFVVGSICMFFSNFIMALISLGTPLWIAVFFNVVRYIAIGCMLMPLTTWCCSYVSKYLADASALLITLRSLSSSIGSAVFVGIMNYVSGQSRISYGAGADMRGLNASFMFLSLAPAVLIIMSIFFVKPKRKCLEPE